jgi:hypothetical protein
MSKYPEKTPLRKRECPNCLNDFKTRKARFCSQVCKNAWHYRKRAEAAKVGREVLLNRTLGASK